MMVKAGVLEGLDDGFVIGSPRLLESSGKTSKTISYSPILFQFPMPCVFGQPRKEKW